MKNIIIVGFPGAGKTTAGRILARLLGRPFIDLDEAVEMHYKATVSHLFRKYGEFAFRKCEQATLRAVLKRDGVVVAAGGGTPCFADNMDRIVAAGIAVYLRLPASVLTERLGSSRRVRPHTSCLEGPALRQYVNETLAAREPFYSRAQVVVDAEGLSPEELAERLSRPIP